MAAVKQIKIGNTNYDIKALNAANENQSAAVVRDIQYGTAAPSGGNAGQVYLQYNNSDVDNPYVYAEDTIGTLANVMDLYATKSEIATSVTSNNFYTSTAMPTNTAYLTNGILMKWGRVVGSGSANQRINFDSPFPNACVLVACTAEAGPVTRLYGSYLHGTPDKNGFNASIVAVSKDETYYSTGNISYIAIGY